MRLLLLVLAPLAAQPPDAALWEAILSRHVNAEARVDYAALPLADLDRYLETVARPWRVAGVERKAALINAYNALMVRWIAGQYPVWSVFATPDPFRAVRHRVDGRMVSLDAIETELRGMGDARIHAVLVCAARSCPPLRREAYVAGRLDAQLDDNAHRWLANPALHGYDPNGRRVEASEIFTWYAGDFDGGVPAFFSRYAPDDHRAWVATATFALRTYDWSLNDSGGAGGNFGKPRFYWTLLMHNPSYLWPETAWIVWTAAGAIAALAVLRYSIRARRRAG